MPINVRYERATISTLFTETANIKNLTLNGKNIITLLDEKINELDKKLEILNNKTKNDDVNVNDVKLNAIIEHKLKELAPLFKGEKGDKGDKGDSIRGAPGISKQGPRGLRGPNKLADLNDVDTSVPLEDGHILAWNSEKRKFVPTQIFESDSE